MFDLFNICDSCLKPANWPKQTINGEILVCNGGCGVQRHAYSKCMAAAAGNEQHVPACLMPHWIIGKGWSPFWCGVKACRERHQKMSMN